MPVYLLSRTETWIVIAASSLGTRLPGQRYPKCVAGAQACPPEDCGGIPGYQSLLEILFDPFHPEHDSLNRWIPRGWGPELFKTGPLKVLYPGA